MPMNFRPRRFTVPRVAPIAHSAASTASHSGIRSIMQEIETLARDAPKTPEHTMLMDSVRTNPSHNNLVVVRQRLREMFAPAPASQVVRDIPVVQGTSPYVSRNIVPVPGDSPTIAEARDRLAGMVYRETLEGPLRTSPDVSRNLALYLTEPGISLTELESGTRALLSNSEMDHTLDGTAPMSIFQRPEARSVFQEEELRSSRGEPLSGLHGREQEAQESKRARGIRDSVEKIKNREGKPPSLVELADVQEGRPWPDFIGDWIPLDVENNIPGHKTMMNQSGQIQSVPGKDLDEWPIAVGQLGVHSGKYHGENPDSYFTSYTHLGPDIASFENMKEFIRERPSEYSKIRAAGKNIIPEAMKKQAEVHGTLYSDVAGRNSPHAERALSVAYPDEANVKVYETGRIPAHKIEHTKGGNIRGIVDQLRAQGRDIPEEKVQEYLKKYGGSAILAGAGLSAWLEERKNKKEETPLEGEE